MKKTLRFLPFCALLLAMIFAGGLFLTTPITLAEDAMPVDIEFTHVARQGKTVQERNVTYNSGNDATAYFYDEIEKIKFTINQNVLDQYSGKENYRYEIDVKRAQMRSNVTTFESSDTDTDHDKKTIENIYSGSLENLTAEKEFEYYFDPAVNDENENLHGIGWGIYKLYFNIIDNNDETVHQGVSKYIIVDPASIPTNDPLNVRQVSSFISSRYKMQNTFDFEITDEIYRYCDQNIIVWYMMGQAIDGTKYVLTNTDVGKIDGYNKGMYDASDSIVRTGRTFHFDAKYSGTWTIWCVVEPDTPSAKISAEFEVTTEKKINTQILIWSLVSAGVVMLGVIIFVIVYTKKHEKVW